jgi:hypothetical protein
MITYTHILTKLQIKRHKVEKEVENKTPELNEPVIYFVLR